MYLLLTYFIPSIIGLNYFVVTFEEMERLLSIFGYEKSNKGKTSGLRVIFKNGDKRPIMIHKPHPGNLIKGYAMKQVLNDLMDAGFIK